MEESKKDRDQLGDLIDTLRKEKDDISLEKRELDEKFNTLSGQYGEKVNSYEAEKRNRKMYETDYYKEKKKSAMWQSRAIWSICCVAVLAMVNISTYLINS